MRNNPSLNHIFYRSYEELRNIKVSKYPKNKSDEL